jgi:hypothetical protein
MGKQAMIHAPYLLFTYIISSAYSHLFSLYQASVSAMPACK